MGDLFIFVIVICIGLFMKSRKQDGLEKSRTDRKSSVLTSRDGDIRTDRRKAEKTGSGVSVAAVGDKVFDFFSGDKEDTGDTFSWKASDPTPTSYGSSGAVSHDHIPSTALDTEKRLEQLKRMLDAGLIDKDEYRDMKRKITGE